ncbi:MAG: response regulator [Actinomycetota bacterium]|nr:response regulator [Actinomycetota bacterium]
MTETSSPSGRILVVEDDPATRAYVARALGGSGFDVVAVDSVPPAIELLASEEPFDVLLADIGLPGASGFDLVREAKVLRPRLPIALMTADASVDVAVQALRSEVDDFLTKPVAPATLVDQVTNLVSRGRASAGKRERVLAVGAHPDDVEIGAGGVLLAHRQAGDEVAVLTLSQGALGGDKRARAGESAEAARRLGARLYLQDLEDTHISESNPTVAHIEEAIGDFRPTVVYTHSINDLHQDHRNVHRATMVAARTTSSLYCYESPSATVDFRPVRFVAVDAHLERKLEVIRAFASQVEIRSYLDEELVRATCRYWGRYGASRYCEAFEVIRERPRERSDG